MKTYSRSLFLAGLVAFGPPVPAQTSLIPGDASSVGLTHIVPDMLCWYHTNNFVTLGPVTPAEQVRNLGNWEPYSSVLGDSVFLVEANTFADDGLRANQRYGLVFQPTVGGAPRLGNAFYDDQGKPYTNKINLSRQNGNPGRVAGDKRYGARSFAAGGECSLYGFPASFNSDGRFNASLPFYQSLGALSTGGRDACVQAHALDPSTLAQTMLCIAFDSAFDWCCTDLMAISDQISRFGGDLVGLDNGDFVSVVEDRSRFKNPSANAVVATIFRPDGSHVKEAFKIADGDIWANVAAHRGGFCVRVAGVLYFHDNAGNLLGSVNQTTSGLAFDATRGDGCRLASDIRSDYVYLAGRTPDTATSPVSLAIWDARTRTFVTNAVVSDTDPALHTIDRVNLAVDALDRVCVAYAMSPDKRFFTALQIAARVLQFDGTNITYLTSSFFPFVNHENDTNEVRGIITSNPSLAMTTKAICIAGKGTVNSNNNPAAGPDTQPETTLYTVLSHPAPIDPPRPQLAAVRLEGNLILSWPVEAGLFRLQSTPNLVPAAWSDVTPQPAITPVDGTYEMTVAIGSGRLFLRLAR